MENKPITARRPRRGRRAHGTRRVSAELALILNLVRSRSAVTRQEIEQQSGLGRAVVAHLIATLVEGELLEEGALGPPSGGRAPRLVEFRADAGLILVAVLDRSMISVGATNLSGGLLIEHHEAADIGDGPEAILKRLGALFDWVVEHHQQNRNLWGIGIAVPGPVELTNDGPNDRPQLHVLPAWDQFPLVDALAARHGVPVWVRNTAQVMTLGETSAGTNFNTQEVLFVKIGKSISAGLLSQGRFHRGAHGAAGLIGHISTGDSTVVCRCGNTGCLEVVAGETAIADEALRAANDGRSPRLAEMLATNGDISATDVAHAAQLGDPFSAELLARCGRLVGTALAALANAFNPSLVVLSGDIVEADDIFPAAIREAVYRRSHPLVTRDLRIVRSQMGNSAGLVGMAIVAIESLFSTVSLSSWIHLGSPLRQPEIADFIVQARRRMNEAATVPRPPRAAGANART